MYYNKLCHLLVLVCLSKNHFWVLLIGLSLRCTQPIQQHGRRTPSSSSLITRSTCFFLVCSVLTFIVQQIHSLRASGVRSSHLSKASESIVNALYKSSGTLCTAPSDICCLAIDFYINFLICWGLFNYNRGFVANHPCIVSGGH